MKPESKAKHGDEGLNQAKRSRFLKSLVLVILFKALQSVQLESREAL